MIVVTVKKVTEVLKAHIGRIGQMGQRVEIQAGKILPMTTFTSVVLTKDLPRNMGSTAIYWIFTFTYIVREGFIRQDLYSLQQAQTHFFWSCWYHPIRTLACVRVCNLFLQCTVYTTVLWPYYLRNLAFYTKSSILNDVLSI